MESLAGSRFHRKDCLGNELKSSSRRFDAADRNPDGRARAARFTFGFALMAAALISGVLIGTTAANRFAAGAGRYGYDVSYPNCSHVLPRDAGFAIIGLNGGMARNANPCFHDELAWAISSPGLSRRHKIGIYVNSGNPGGIGGAFWPRANRDPMTGDPVRDPYGICLGRDDPMCAWQYGWNVAQADVRRLGVARPETYTWWLDVERANTWEGRRASNRAVLEGMAASFRSIGLDVGVYSTLGEWRIIVGSIGPRSALYGLDEWLGFGRSRGDAQLHCRSRPFTAGGEVVITQWTEPKSNLDRDYFCRPSDRDVPGVRVVTP